MKLCRFDLISSPGTVRSGLVYGGKVYETDGSNPVAVHEWTDARLLTPIGHAPSVRLFEPDSFEAEWLGMAEGREAAADFSFTYLNPSIIVGPQMELMPVHFSDQITCKPCLAAVISADATLLTPAEAEGALLGLSLANIFVATDVERVERQRGSSISRSHDLGIAIGPAITTIDELADAARTNLNGTLYSLTISVQVNESEVARLDSADLALSFSEAASFASSSCAIRAGDVICVSLGELKLESPLKSGDEVRLVSDRLGTLVNRVG